MYMSSGLRNCCRHVYEEKNSQVFSSLRYLCLGWQYHQEEEQPRCHNCQSKWQVKRLDLFSRRKYLSRDKYQEAEFHLWSQYCIRRGEYWHRFLPYMDFHRHFLPSLL